MMSKKMAILEIVGKYPETEKIISTYDDIVGKCVLCDCLFDTIYILSIEYDINLENLIDKINEAIKKLVNKSIAKHKPKKH